MMKKKGFVTAIVVVLIAAIVVGVAAILLNAVSPVYKGRTAIIYNLDGEGVVVERGEEPETAYAGMRLKGGDAVVTDAETMVTIRVDNDKDILLGKQSRMEITTLEDMSLVLTLTKGEFFFNVAEKLGMGETMVFRIGATSMSIRGTSGGGAVRDDEGQFVIITGAGAITTGDSEDVEVYVIPKTKVQFNSNTGYDTETATVSTWTASEDQTEAMTSFLQTNDDYREMLNEQGWVINEEGTIEEEPVIEITPEDKVENYIGWRQLGDGSWEFSQEDFDAGVGPTYYVYPEKPVAEGDNVFVYDGTEKTVALSHFDPENMTIEYGSSTEVGYFTAMITPIYHWADETTDPVYVRWSVIPAENDLGTFIYNGKDQTVVPEGFDAGTMTITGNVARNAGTYTVYVTSRSGEWQDGSDEPFVYSWTIKPAVISFTETEMHRVYDGTTEFSAVLTPVEGVELHVEAEALGDRVVGTYSEVPVTLSLTNANGNYVLNKTQAAVTVVIDQKVLTIDDLKSEFNFTYNGGNQFQENYDGEALADIVGDDDVAILLSMEIPEMDVRSFTGICVTATLDGEDAGNYAFVSDGTYADNTLLTAAVTINPAPMKVTVDSLTVTYGDTVDSQDFVWRVQGLIGDETVEFTCHAPFDHAGEYDITVEDWGGDYRHYDITVEAGKLKVLPKTINVKAPTLTIGYGSEVPNLNALITYEGLVEGDVMQANVWWDVNIAANTYTTFIQMDSSKYPDYICNTENGVLTIRPAQVIVTIDDASKTYGEPDPAFTVYLSGVKYNDEIRYTCTRDEGEDVGEYAIIVTIDTSLYPNYTFACFEATLTINPQDVIVSVRSTSKMYGEPDPEIEFESSAGNANQGRYSITRAPGETVGTYTITIDSADFGPNYRVTEKRGGTLTILKRTMTFEPEAQMQGGKLVWVDAITNDLEDKSAFEITRTLWNMDNNNIVQEEEYDSLAENRTYKMQYTITCSDPNIEVITHFRTFVFRNGTPQDQQCGNDPT